MRIVYLADAPYPHTWRWVQHFAAAGHECHVISFRPAEIAGATVHHINGVERLGKARYLLHARRIGRLIESLQPDLLHALHLTSYGFLGSLSGFHPFLLSVWGTDILEAPQLTPFHRWLTRHALARADAITATGLHLALETTRHTPPATPVTVVPYGVDLQRFHPRDASSQVESAQSTPAPASPLPGTETRLGDEIPLASTSRTPSQPPTSLSLEGEGRGEREPDTPEALREATAPTSPLLARRGVGSEEAPRVGPNVLGPTDSPPLPRTEGGPGSEVPLVIGTTARLSPEKGLAYLIDAFARLRDRYGDRVRLRIAGEGPERGALEHQIARLHLASSVDLAGWLDYNEIPAFLHGLDVFALPSTWEGFGVSAVEASATGLPVVASNIHGIPDAVVDGLTGLLVPPKDPEALAHALTRLIDDAALRTNLGAAGRAFVARNYDWTENAAQMQRLYEGLTAGGRSG